MDRWLLYIIGIVCGVIAVGIITLMPGNLLAGAATAEHPCQHCIGQPVCAVKGQTAYNYPDACTAQCDGARVIFKGICERIPLAQE